MKNFGICYLLIFLGCPGPVFFCAAHDFLINGKKFTLPDGFTIELVSKNSLIERPISCDFDHLGRLYVTESSGTNDNVKQQLQAKPHRIIRLEDSNGDGRFDRRTVYADRMMFPEGSMWHDGSLYVAAPPQIWKLTDTDNDGVADRREVWFDGKTLTGCANDLHGPYLGPDGWIYWCKGAFAEQTYPMEANQWVTRASHIFRRRPEGGPIESVMTGGMDNPVELVFTPEGERVFNATFLHHPHDGKRDGLVHAIYGGVYGKDHGVLEGHPRTGDLMPVLADQDASAPSGLVRLKSSALGTDFENNILCTSFNMHKVFRHRLKYVGSLLTATVEDFVVCHDLDFHPTDIIEDADGSLLIVDTGGWYKLCCPTSQLQKPDVLGGIYRVRRTDAGISEDPRGLKIDWLKTDPVRWIADRRFFVREKAQWLASKRSPVSDLKKILTDSAASEFQRLEAIWTLAKCPLPLARKVARHGLMDSSPMVRQAAAHSISVWKDAGAVDKLHGLLNSDSPMNRRVAAEALGRLGDSRAIPWILETAGKLKTEPKNPHRVVDRGLEHSLIYALIQLKQPGEIAKGLLASSVGTQHVAMMALAELNSSHITKSLVLDRVKSEDPLLRSTAWQLLQKHPQWADDLAVYFRKKFEGGEVADVSKLKPLIKNPAIAEEIRRFLWQQDLNQIGVKLSLLQMLAEARFASSDGLWQKVPCRLLESPNESILLSTIEWLSHYKNIELTKIREQLRNIARNPDHSDQLRLLAFATGKLSALNDEDVRFVSQKLAADFSVATRSLALQTLQASRLRARQREIIVKQIATTGPAEILSIVQLVLDPDPEDEERTNLIAMALLRSLRISKAFRAIDPSGLRKSLGQLANAVEFQKLLLDLESKKKNELQRMNKILARLPTANVRRGQEIFHSNKASCIACHQMGYLGGRIGPSLSRIGRIRTEQDLLESLMFPNLSFVRSYEPVVVETIDGKQYTGIIKNETARELVLTLDAHSTVRLDLSNIENRKIGSKSIMPSGLDQQFSEQELADLIKFLKESK